MTALRDATNTSSFDAALRDTASIIVDFYTPSCVLCRKVEPMLIALERGLEGQLRVIKVDAAANLELAARYDVRGVPTLILFKDSEIQDRKTGFMTAAMLRDWVRPFLQ